jgi:TRAP-type C4-dicarboxylate transport system permease small subunit
MQPADQQALSSLARRLDGLSRILNSGVEKLVAAITAVMVAVVAAQVFARYILNHSLFWSEELARYLLVWLAVLGATAGYRRGLHPGLDLFHGRLHSIVIRGMQICTAVISLFFFAVLVYHGVSFAHFIRAQISPALQIPKWIVFSIIPLGGAVFVVHTVALLFKPFGGVHDDG